MDLQSFNYPTMSKKIPPQQVPQQVVIVEEETKASTFRSSSRSDNNGRTCPCIMAPMVMGSELAYRMLVRNYGINICYSPMLRASMVVKGYRSLLALKKHQHYQKQQQQPYKEEGCDIEIGKDLVSMSSSPWRLLDTTSSSLQSSSSTDNNVLNHDDVRLAFADYHPEDIPLLVVQLCGNDPKDLADATTILLEYYTTTRTGMVVEEEDLEKDVEDSFTDKSATTSSRTTTTILGIDLNLGCPQPCARDGKFGAFLGEDYTELALECVRAMRKAMDEYRIKYDLQDHHHIKSNSDNDINLAVATSSSPTSPIPRLSCKIRLLPNNNIYDNATNTENIKSKIIGTKNDTYDDEETSATACANTNTNTNTTLKYCQSLVDAGCELIAVHCRHRTNKNAGCAERDIVYELVSTLNHIPIVVNGGIDSNACAHQTMMNSPRELAGIMIAQGLLENPRMLMTSSSSLSSSTTTFEDNNDNKSQALFCADIAAEYLDYAEKYPPPSSLFIRKHLRWIFRKQLQPISKHPTPEEYKTNWRSRLWTFLVRPYLTGIDQFRLVVLLFVQCNQCDTPTRLLSHKQRFPNPITFSTIRHYRP